MVVEVKREEERLTAVDPRCACNGGLHMIRL
jgi:hypothetical protein